MTQQGQGNSMSTKINEIAVKLLRKGHVKEAKELLAMPAPSYMYNRERSKQMNGLDLLAQIRKGEDELGLPEIELPSEDSIMDHPTKFNVKMRQVLSKQTQIRDLITTYKLQENVNIRSQTNRGLK